MRVATLLAIGALITAPLRSEAQVWGTIVIGGLPVGAVVSFGHPRYGYDARPVPMSRVIVVERWRHPSRRDCRDLNRRRVWYDRHEGAYDDRYRRGLVEVDVYERDGRYFRPDDRDRDDRWYDQRERRGKRDPDDRYDSGAR